MSDVSHTIHRDIWNVCISLEAYLALLEDPYVLSKNLSRLVITRNVLQRKVLSTLALPIEAISTMDHLLRQTCLVFSLGVTFPISRSLALHTVCQGLSVAYVDYSYSQESLSEPPDFSSWICLLGAIAAKSCGSTPLYSFFLDELVRIQISGLRPAQDLFEITSRIQSYLWLDVACQETAANVWEEVVAKLHQNQKFAFYERS